MQRIKSLCFILLLLPGLLAAEPSTELQQEALNHLKDELITAINHNQIDRIVDNFLPNATIILENGQIFHSRAQLKEFIKSPNSVEEIRIKKFIIEKVDVDNEVTVVDESTFIASGTARFQYQLVKGKNIDVPVRWSATINQEIDKWKIASFQNTVNVLENPIIDEMQSDFYMMCFIAFIIGLIIGYAWKKMIRKKT